jgi:hypothetical protein
VIAETDEFALDAAKAEVEFSQAIAVPAFDRLRDGSVDLVVAGSSSGG